VHSIAALRQRCQEHKWAQSRGLTRLNRYLSIYVTAVLVRTNVSANTLTVASILVGLAGSGCLLLGSPVAGVTGVALLYLSFMLDQVDGEVARYWNATSLSGSYLDEIRHILMMASPVFAAGLGLVFEGESALVSAAAFIAALAIVVLRFNLNARYLLVSKKLLAAANGAVARVPARLGRRRETGRSQPSSSRGALRSVYSAIVYVATNQVSVLTLLLVFELLSAIAPVRPRAAGYVGYSLLLLTIAVVDCAGMVRGRLERSSADLLATFDTRPSAVHERVANE
jgi:phosphatidylglycerophosphate synthase